MNNEILQSTEQITKLEKQINNYKKLETLCVIIGTIMLIISAFINYKLGFNILCKLLFATMMLSGGIAIVFGIIEKQKRNRMYSIEKEIRDNDKRTKERKNV